MSNKMNVVPLQFPIDGAGGKKITSVELMKPNVGALRGLMLAQVQMQDVNTLLTLWPRITKPALSPDDLAQLDPADFAEMANKTSLFFMKQTQLDGVLLEMQAS